MYLGVRCALELGIPIRELQGNNLPLKTAVKGKNFCFTAVMVNYFGAVNYRGKLAAKLFDYNSLIYSQIKLSTVQQNKIRLILPWLVFYNLHMNFELEH